MNANGNQDAELDRLERSLRASEGLDAPSWELVRHNLADRADAAGLVDVAFERQDRKSVV